MVDLNSGREVRRLRAPTGTLNPVPGTDVSVVVRPAGGNTMYERDPPSVWMGPPTRRPAERHDRTRADENELGYLTKSCHGSTKGLRPENYYGPLVRHLTGS